MPKTVFQLGGLILVVTCLLVSNSHTQVTKVEKPKQKIWFIARVINTEPFMLEYVDDWYRYQESSVGMSGYGVSVDTNPQSQLEDIKQFKVGDMISGEFCHSTFDDCGSAVRISEAARTRDPEDNGRSIPPPIAINLKKLGNKYKIKYAKKGFLITYNLSEKNIIQGLSISRDGRIDLISYEAGEITRWLSAKELAKLEKAYFESQTDKILSSTTDEYFKRSLSTVFGSYRHLQIDESSKDTNMFLSLLDELIEKYVRNATYRINYRWVFRIKDWQFGDILPLDEAAAEPPKYLLANWKRLSETKAPPRFFEEAKQKYGFVAKNYYRYKGKLYYFEFGTYTDRPTGSWACFQANEAGTRDLGKFTPGFEEWPSDLSIKLRKIPQTTLIGDHELFGKGLEIPGSDFLRNRDFYSRFLRERGEYREGEYVYSGLKVWFH